MRRNEGLLAQYRLVTFQRERVIEIGENTAVNCLAFNENGTMLFVGLAPLTLRLG